MKIGILGASQILYFSIIWPSQHLCSPSAYAIDSRNHEKAKEYAKKWQIIKVFKSYKELLQCKEIDFVYISLPNHLHKEMIIKSAQHKKHILVEKPICLNYREFEEISKVCKHYNVLLLEGIMIQHHPWQNTVKKYIQNNKLGKINHISTNISFIPKYNLNENYRGFPAYGGGCFYDLAPYWLQILQSVLDLNPISFEGESSFSGPNNCDMSFNATLKFPNEIISSFSASFENPYNASVQFSFEHGRILVNNIFRANIGKHNFILEIEKTLSNNDISTEEIICPPENYYINQLNFFTECISGKQENIDITKSGERIKLLEKIYLNALKKRKMQK